jgi:hypothetical protein
VRAVLVLVPVAVCVVAGVAPARASARFAHCGDVRVDRFLQSDRNGDFGAFDVTRTGTTCKAARRVASRYVRDPRVVLRPKRIDGWRCTIRSQASCTASAMSSVGTRTVGYSGSRKRRIRITT